METFDIAVIGAGPAGNFAALTSAKRGLSTIVFEEHESIGEPVHCGECLSSLACKRLGIELPDEAISLEMKGIRLVFPDRTASFITEPGYTLEKEKFEQHLSLLATKAGASYKLRHRVTALSREGAEGIWRIVTTSGEYFARIIIDASGVDGAASKLLKLNEPPKTVVGLQYEMSPIESDGFLDFFLWPRLSPHGYLWIIPKKDGRANVGLVTDDAPKTRAYLEQFIDEYGLKEKKRVKAFGGRIPASGPVKNTYSDGILLAGDAAGFASPVFEGGSSLAMASGKFAAETAADALAKKDISAKSLSPYEQKWRSTFPDYHTLVSGKRKLYGFTDEELNKIGKLIPHDLTTLSFLDKAKTGANVLLTAPQLLSKGFVPAMEALGKSRAEHFGW